MNGSGLIPVASASALEATAKAAAQKEAEAKQNSQLIQGLAGHAKSRWELVNEGRSTYEERLAKNLRQRKGEYDPDTLQAIKEIGGSEIFMGITSVKCRAASAWLRDTLTGNGTDKPWKLYGTPIPDLPPEVVERIHGELTRQIQEYMMTMGQMPPEDQVRALAEQMRDQSMGQLRDESKKRVERMEVKMEDQLVEGGFRDTFSQFIDDLCTFPAAILKGPVPRKHKTLQWNGDLLEPVDKVQDDWDRIDPFKFYFAPWASSVNSGPIIERHSLTRSDLFGMIGVEGYSEPDIRAILSDFDGGGLRSWLDVSADSVQATAEGRTTGTTRDTDLIDAIQLWDEVQGSKLIEWGMDSVSVPDPESSYPCEVWLIGTKVIKAVLNYDPLGRKPYYVTSYEKIPGQLIGNSVPDLVRDPQDMCNAAARSLSNNMGISSGPQVGVNVDRLPVGEEITSLFPWKTWQFKAADYQDGTPPISFFQPNSNAQELMAVFDRFLTIADEVSGIPRYMQGETVGSAGRTSSGLAQLISNATKSMKQVVNNIDTDVLQPLLERQYQRNLRYSQDPDLIGDVTIQAKGAMSLVAKEAAAVRRAEFMQLALNSPIVQQIIGIPGTAELLRDAAKMLDLSVDSIVPSKEAIAQMVAQQQQQQEMMMQAAMNPELEQVNFQRDENGAVTGATKKKPKQLLPDGSQSGGREQSTARNVVTGRNG